MGSPANPGRFSTASYRGQYRRGVQIALSGGLFYREAGEVGDGDEVADHAA